jgi:integrase
MTINFYLDSKENKQGQKTVYCFIRGIAKKHTLQINTGIKVFAKDWNTDRQQVRKSFAGYSDVNVFFDKIRSQVQVLYSEYIRIDNNFNINHFKMKILEFLNGNNQKYTLDFFELFDEFLKARTGSVTQSTINSYKDILSYLKKFQANRKYKLTMDSINMTFFDSFLSYLQNTLGLTNNTVHIQVKFLKVFMNWATERGYNNNLEFRKFKTKPTEVEIVYLTENELMSLLGLEIADKKLANLRDVFCFACFTGARFSDVSNIKPEDVKNGIWSLRTQKTRDMINIPLSKYAKAILSKYFDNNKPFPVISNQKSNAYLKELGKLAGIDDKVIKIRYQGAKRMETTHPKYELITTHTARRTFVTLSLEKGLRAETVMKITGHKDYKTMKRYLKITENVVKSEMERVWG